MVSIGGKGGPYFWEGRPQLLYDRLLVRFTVHHLAKVWLGCKCTCPIMYIMFRSKNMGRWIAKLWKRVVFWLPICRGRAYPRFWTCVFKSHSLPSTWTVLVEFCPASSEGMWWKIKDRWKKEESR